MPDAYITLTQRMLSKSEINANKTVQQFLLEDFGMEYTDKFFENRNKLNTGKSTMHHVHFFNPIVYSEKILICKIKILFW